MQKRKISFEFRPSTSDQISALSASTKASSTFQSYLIPLKIGLFQQIETVETKPVQQIEPNIEETKNEPDLKLDMIPTDKVDGLHSVAAVMENRAHEIGIAVFTPDLSKVTMTQLVDTSCYHHTVTFLNMMEAKTVVFSQSLLGTALHLVLTGQGQASGQHGMKSAVKSAIKQQPAAKAFKLLILPRQFFSE